VATAQSFEQTTLVLNKHLKIFTTSFCVRVIAFLTLNIISNYLFLKIALIVLGVAGGVRGGWV
jgi:hypothetical protein